MNKYVPPTKQNLKFCACKKIGLLIQFLVEEMFAVKLKFQSSNFKIQGSKIFRRLKFKSQRSMVKVLQNPGSMVRVSYQRPRVNHQAGL
jgi:hypothetical protein